MYNTKVDDENWRQMTLEIPHLRSHRSVQRFSRPKSYTVAAVTCLQFLPARRYTSAGTSYGPVSVCVCVCHKSVFYRNDGGIELEFGM